eukprot:7514509-Prorocentrum_lima.AAC.1
MLRVAKCIGVTDLDGNSLMPLWEQYVYLNNQVLSLAQHPLRVPNVASRIFTEHGHRIVVEDS